MAQNLNNHSKEEICNALEIIKDICYRNTCSECPFGRGDNDCILQKYAPVDLEIENQENVWRALK